MKQKNLRFGQIIASLAVVAASIGLFASCGKEKGVVASPSFSIADFVGTYEEPPPVILIQLPL